MWSRAKNRLKGNFTDAFGDAALNTERLMGALTSVQQLRVWAEELQSAVLHLSALPTRQDIRHLHRQVVQARKQVQAVDEALDVLESKTPKM